MAAAGVLLEKSWQRRVPHRAKSNRMARWGKQRSARVVAVCPESRVMVTCGKAESQSEAALLRLVETLVQRLLGVSQTPQ
jgi:hypothetical protein